VSDSSSPPDPCIGKAADLSVEQSLAICHDVAPFAAVMPHGPEREEFEQQIADAAGVKVDPLRWEVLRVECKGKKNAVTKDRDREPGEDDDLDERTGIPLVPASQIPDEPIEWLEPGFLARGELTDLSGDPGVGKGAITISWAAKHSHEAPVLMLVTEDRLSHVAARLRAEGANLDRVFLLDIRQENCGPVLPSDINELERVVLDRGAALVVLDPALEFMSGELDSHKQQDVQRFTAALAGLAQRTKAAVVVVRHLNKTVGTSAIYKGAGSIAFVARARMALLVAKDKQHGGRVLTVVKGNFAKDTLSVTFDIVEKDGSTVVVWGEASTVTADELVNQQPKRHGPAPQKGEALRDLLTTLTATGAVAKAKVVAEAERQNLGSRTLVYEVAKKMGLADCTVDLKSGWKRP